MTSRIRLSLRLGITTERHGDEAALVADALRALRLTRAALLTLAAVAIIDSLLRSVQR